MSRDGRAGYDEYKGPSQHNTQLAALQNGQWGGSFDQSQEIAKLREEVASLRAYATSLEQTSAARETQLQNEIASLRSSPNQEVIRLQRENKDLKQLLQVKEKEMMGRILTDQNPNVLPDPLQPQQKGGFSSVGRPNLLEQRPLSANPNFMQDSHHSLDESVYFAPQRKQN